MSNSGYNIVFTIFVLIVFIVTMSCDDFLKVDVEKSQITKDAVFSNPVTATSAVTGIYSDMYNTLGSFASGSYRSVTGLCAMSGGELNYYPDDAEYLAFEKYKVMPTNTNVLSLWTSMYYAIYGANNVIEGLNKSSGLALDLKNQLLGEALFIRAFSYFYLVNLFGPVPIVNTTDYLSNSILSRNEVSDVYRFIISDLRLAQSLVSNEYLNNSRTRPNRCAVTTLLSRVYLYTGDHENAELQATDIIEDSRYELLDNLDEVFLSDSREAIWQLRPSLPSYNTNEAEVFLLDAPPDISPYNPFAITNELLQSFEENDLRMDRWVNLLASDSADFFYPFKYRISYGSLLEYSMVFRLAEIYLIRSESRAIQGNLAGAIADLDSIRNRAMLPLFSDFNPSVSKGDLIIAIEHERQVELFTEWGHRWMDLKRTRRADQILSGNDGYSYDAKLYPIPQSEFERNRSLGSQNPGY
ncbi:RagB/SusD family nutrient uptake outer membrane protein [Dawidia soli]|uniref:RagB/SusD family nutrient uptake outer membrane protein n=1 Tax=Dawidia soli TaxID=2782352 RepID=A0AAP2GD88_9BACT|nr:RagB/SusD family nutrient uptake outer membrane protein [Dawidia soli]MBT1687109.1 RagB/SusD family nutrient uptake outer membrane protein [Dawidia soli]